MIEMEDMNRLAAELNAADVDGFDPFEWNARAEASRHL